MLTDPKLRSAVESLWDKLWSGGLNNPLAVHGIKRDSLAEQFFRRENGP